MSTLVQAHSRLGLVARHGAALGVATALFAIVGPAAASPLAERPAPVAAVESPVEPPSIDPPPIETVIDVGDNRPERFYDAAVAAAMTDIEAMWDEAMPALYGKRWEPLAGGVYAAYPERTEPIPGCGFGSTSTYQDVSDFGAFYCPIGDFVAFDDGEDGLLYTLSELYGEQVIPVVLVHEYAHAVQQRIGAFEDRLPTIYTEQQADCFAGAWSRRAWDGHTVSGVVFGDADVLTGLRALHAVRDPVGNDLLDDGGHGSAFDRIGAYQTGFLGGIELCVGLLDEPLPLLPNVFASEQDRGNQGDAPFGYGQGGAMAIVTAHLDIHWRGVAERVGFEMPELSFRVVADPQRDNCGEVWSLVITGAAYCPSTHEVLFNERRARELYDSFGDFAVGYIIGHAWADAAQDAYGSPLSGKWRSLVSDCLTGAWVATTLSDRPWLTPGATTMVASPGDLDEAVLTAIQFGDAEFGTGVEGSAFEKIAYLRIGVIDGTMQCFDQIPALAG